MTQSLLPTVPSAAATAALALLLSGCAATGNFDMPRAGTPPTDPANGMPATHDARANPAAAPESATAQVALSNPAGGAAGQATLRELPGRSGVEIAIEVQGMAPGRHGFHIHAHGACAPGPDAATGQIVPFGAAGGHFDPFMTRNHGRPGQSANDAHAGELPNIEVGADGSGRLRYTNPHVTLQPGETSVLGRTLVVHERADDYASDPAGDSGGRIACGLIEPAGPSMVTGRAVFEGANVFPEGIAIDPASGVAYVGSSTEGHIYRVAPGAAQAELFQSGGSPGRQAAYGMEIDRQGRLWVAGGTTDTVALVDLKTAATVQVVEGPKDGHAFLNDLAMAGPFLYVTDSFRPVLWRIDTRQGPSARLERWLDLRTTPVRYKPNEINWNGIVASPDGRWLLAVQQSTGELWRIHTETRAVTPVRLEGGDLQHGDGLLLVGATDLYVVRNAAHELVRVTLATGWDSGRVVQRLHDPRLKYPTTAALAGSAMWVVNGQTDKQKAPPPLLPFDVLRIGLPR
ncbi:superoxide dismutase family protein [Acidovorax sp. Leaf160]|uniref:superoxide dismutase family protein n=1 Tax=Acidovorax sp. Leaf160 TaxID=1736280 RepID=UPI0006F7F725|nr:superoxide dismutase family protein [Acidovorax sp. Leaf160]KQR45743.1 superoxide dismutase [Acidovorax sp. Leaf160]